MNVPILTSTTVIPTPCVPTPRDLSCVVALEDSQGMAKTALVIVCCSISSKRFTEQKKVS